jgi:ABC-type uncharacterized transport system involved in gliding motility auxiliary subunit/ABC-type transport system involved in multi-copper enzyme maturation permease subunit
MRVLTTVARRELAAYFSTPLAYVFMVAFLAAAGAATFYFGGFMERRQADLTPFFNYHPWLFLVLIPAIGMRLWAEERRYGTVELLMTLPITPWQAVLGKFFAAWLFVSATLALTFPIWLSVNYLGEPDNGVILASYLASFLMAGALLAAASCVSAITSSQVVAFVFGVAISFLLLLFGLDFVLNLLRGWAPQYLIEVVASFSLLTHFNAIARGVLDARAIVFLGSLIVLFLFINRQFVEVSRALAPVAITLAILLFLCVNIAASLALGSARIDLTEGRIYTVSPSTRSVLDAVPETVTLRFYLSSALLNEVPQIRVYADRVTELLRTYERLSGGRVRVDRIDPVPFSSEEDRAISYGLTGFNLSRAGERGYIGLVGTNSLDQIEIIPALTIGRERQLEYDITRMVQRLSSPTEPRIGVIDGLGLFGSTALGRLPSAMIERMGDDFELVQVAASVTAIPDNLDALVIVHPHHLTPSALYAIDQYVIRGGPALVFVDPLSEHSPPDPANRAVPQFPSSYLDPLLAAWGVTMARDRVVGDLDMALEVRAQAGNQVVFSDYPPWLIVRQGNLNPNDPVTSQLTLMRISSAGSLRQLANATTAFTPLIQTTRNSMLYEQATIMRRFDPTQLVNMFQPSGEIQFIAARITGPVATAFPDGPPPAPAPQAGAAPPPPPPVLLTRSEGPINVIVVSDADMLANGLNVNETGRPTTQNADFVINAIDSLTGGGALIGLRGRGLSFRPFTRLDELERAAESRATEQQLQAELRETEARLAELQAQALAPDGQLAVLSRQQQETVTQFNQRIVDVRRELREVQGALRQDIDALSNQLQLINILGAPVLIILIGLAVAGWQRMRLWRYLRMRQARA